MILSRARCGVCGGPLTVHQQARAGVCEGEGCRKAVVQREIARRLEVIESARREQAGRLRDRIAMDRAVPRASLPVFIVPTFRAPVAPLPASRRRNFLRHLRRLIRTVFVERESGATADEGLRADATAPAVEGEPGPARLVDISPGHPAERSDTAVSDLERRACATCRGFCCRLGQDHAFLDLASVRAVIDRFPDRTQREIRRAWMEALPEHAYLDGCVFQGATGCVLDRGMRSWVCNEFRCRDLKSLLASELPGRALEVVLVAVDEDGISRHTTVGIPQASTAG